MFILLISSKIIETDNFAVVSDFLPDHEFPLKFCWKTLRFKPLWSILRELTPDIINAILITTQLSYWPLQQSLIISNLRELYIQLYKTTLI